ncbi:MAG TPA: NAD(+)/NADH kinase [Trebonia sp.]
MHSVGMVLHPQRDSAEAVNAVLGWAARKDAAVYGIHDEIVRLNCAATGVSPAELAQRSDLLVSIGGDGTMLRAMRLADGQRAPVLGVNLGKLGFLAEVDVPDLPAALTAIDAHDYTIEPRLAIDSVVDAAGKEPIDRHGAQPDGILAADIQASGETGQATAFNDIAVVRIPGDGLAEVAVRVSGQPFVSYASDAVIIATPTGSTAYSFSAGGPIVSPAVEALLITPASPHSAFNRGVVLSVMDTVSLEILPGSGRLAVEVDGRIGAYVSGGDYIDLTARPAAARVVRLGRTTFYQRTRRKLQISDPAEIGAQKNF